MKKRLLSSFLALAMVLTMVPITTFATEDVSEDIQWTNAVEEDSTVLSLAEQAEAGY